MPTRWERGKGRENIEETTNKDYENKRYAIKGGRRKTRDRGNRPS